MVTGPPSKYPTDEEYALARRQPWIFGPRCYFERCRLLTLSGDISGSVMRKIYQREYDADPIAFRIRHLYRFLRFYLSLGVHEKH